MKELFSFDIFDTLITRVTATPVGVFLLVQENLNTNFKNIPEILRKNFMTIRIEIEKFLRKEASYKGMEEITLDEIYEHLRENYNLTDATISIIKNLEIETEKKCIIPIYQNIDILKKIYFSGKRVVLISDMYLSVEIIRELLISLDEVFNEITIYTSSEYKIGKHSGRLYEKVKILEDVEFCNWYHFGDNWHSDINMGNRFGIHTTHLDFPSLLPYEQKTLEQRNTDLFTQLTIGTARNCRLYKCHSEKENFGASFGGPILYPYVFWFLSETKKMGVKRLYFIARDGYILKKVFDIICDQYNIKISSHYIYGSRLAWRIPDFEDANGISYLFDEKWNSTTIEMFIKNLNIDISKIKGILPEKYHNPCYKLNDNDFLFLKNLLTSNSEFLTIVKNENSKRKNIVIAYLKQEIDFSDDNFAFVDFTGSGVTQNHLGNIIKDIYPKKIKNFYLRLSPFNGELKNIQKYSLFLNLDYSHFFVESLVRAPHGQTIAYEQIGDKIVPILDDYENNALSQWKYNEYINGVEYFAKAYSKILKKFNFTPLLLTIYCDYFKFIIENIDPVTADLLGSIPFSSQNQIKELRYLAPKYTKKEFKNIFLYNKYPFSEMPELSFLRSSRKIQKAIILRNDIARKIPKIKSAIKKLLHTKYIKNECHIDSYFLGIIKKLRLFNTCKTSLCFFNISIISKYKFTVNNKSYSYYNLLREKTLTNKFYIKIIEAIPEYKGYDHIYLCKHNIGEWYVFLNYLPKLISKSGDKKPLILTAEEKYITLVKMFCPTIPVVFVDLKQYQIDFFTQTENFKIKSIKFSIPYKNRFEDYRTEVLNYATSSDWWFSKYMIEHIGLKQSEIKFIEPIITKAVEDTLSKKLNQIKLNINNFIFITTEARSIKNLHSNFWDKLINRVISFGYDIYSNSEFFTSRCKKLKHLNLNFEEVCLLAAKSRAVIGLRSGLIDLIATYNIPMHIIYTFFPHKNYLDAEQMIKCYTLKQFNQTNRELYEYNGDIEESQLLENIIQNFEKE